VTASTGEPLHLDEQVCYALAVASRSVIALYRPLLDPMGITHPQYLVLLALWESDGRTVGELAAALRLESATLSPLLKRLEALGLVSRRRRETDERIVEITLTAEGRALRAKAESIPAEIVARLGLPIERLADLRDVLHEVIRATT
jgi:DNA-binding MarR family transcriptional regulator